jgi:YggT family protein
LILAVTRGDVANYVDAIFLVYTIMIVGYVITSMIFSFGVRMPYSRVASALLAFLRDVSEPFLRIFRRFMPMIGPFDLSPVAALLVLSFARTIIVRLILG